MDDALVIIPILYMFSWSSNFLNFFIGTWLSNGKQLPFVDTIVCKDYNGSPSRLGNIHTYIMGEVGVRKKKEIDFNFRDTIVL